MSTILENITDNENGYTKRIHVKGASEIVLETCSHYLDAEGNKQELDDSMKALLENTITGYAKQALRTIAFGYKDLSEGEGGPEHDEI